MTNPPAGTGLIKSLVGIRGVLSVVVVAVHLAPTAAGLVPGTSGFWTAIQHHGYWALDLFFVLSGFVIMAGYRKKFATWPGRGPFGRFLWARLSRFYPVHLVVLAALVVAVLAVPGLPHGGDLGWDLVRQLTLTQGWGGAHGLVWNGPTWSLSAEWFCYLLLPAIIPFVLRFRTPAAVIAGYVVSMAIPLVAYGILGYDDAHITYLAPLWRSMGDFLAGAFLCQLMHVGSRIPERLGRITGVVVTVALASVVAASMAGITLLAVVPVAGLTVLALAQQHGRIDALLSGRGAMKAGDVSVSLYLTHVPWLMASSLLVTPARFPGAWGWAGVALMVAGAFVVAWLTFRLIELPSQKLMKRMVGKPRPRPAATPVDHGQMVAPGGPRAAI